MTARRYRVAFSFSEEKRNFVSKLAAELAGRFGEAQILYDEYHPDEFSRPVVDRHLRELYEQQSDLIVVIASPHSAPEEWRGLDLGTIRSSSKKSARGKVLLARFERANPKGLHSTAGFLELDDLTPRQTAELIFDRLELGAGKADDNGRESPGPSGGLPPNNLPPLQSFFGRERELATIGDALSPNRRTWGVLIDGPGGIGKTSLAVRAARAISPGQFQQILFVSSKDRQMTADGERKLSDSIVPGYLDMLNEIARLLKKPELAKLAEAERAHCVIAALKSAQALLILDNLESLPRDQQDKLFDFLGELPQGCKAIATSRVRTDVDARIIRLSKLERQAALDLLAELAQDRELLAEASDAERVQLYEETGGNPLLMRWIAGQLGRGSCGTIPATLAFLRRAPADNDPLEFIFGDLLRTFTENETKVLAALAHFTQMIEVKFIAELAGISRTATHTALGDLSSRALVVPDDEEKKFALVPMVADFLRNKLPEDVRETGDRLADRAYALIVENGYDKHDRFPMLEAAWPTVAPAIPIFLAGPNARLQTVCDALYSFFNFTGRWDDWLSLCEPAEAKAVAAGDHDRAGWRAFHAGSVCSLREQADEVFAWADRAAAHWQSAKAGTRERAAAIRLRGLGHQLKEDYPAAVVAFRESLDLVRSLTAESVDVASALSSIAGAEAASGDFAVAERDFREALRVARKIGDIEGVAMNTGNLAELALNQEDWRGAEKLAREALPVSEKVGRQELIASDCHRIAKALARQGKAADALAYVRRAIEIFTRLGSPDLEEARATLSECEG